MFWGIASLFCNIIIRMGKVINDDSPTLMKVINRIKETSDEAGISIFEISAMMPTREKAIPTQRNTIPIIF